MTTTAPAPPPQTELRSRTWIINAQNEDEARERFELLFKRQPDQVKKSITAPRRYFCGFVSQREFSLAQTLSIRMRKTK